MNFSQRTPRILATFPRLTSSAGACARSHPEQARTIAESLSLVGAPAAVLSEHGELLASNKLFDAIMPPATRDARGLPRLVDAAANRQLEDTVARVCANRGPVRSVPVRGHAGKAPKVISVIPISGAQDGFAGLGAVLVVNTVEPRSAPSLEILKSLFDLSPAEARVAHGIAARKTVEAIAARSGVSRETVRCQLKAVLAKTGTKRQVELAALLLGLRVAKI